MSLDRMLVNPDRICVILDWVCFVVPGWILVRLAGCFGVPHCFCC